MSSLMTRVYILEQEPTEAISYIKIVIFLYSVSVLFPFVEGYSRAQIFVFLLDLSIFFFLSGCESFLPCSSLILLDRKRKKNKHKKKNETVCEKYCNKCCFLDVSCIVGEGNNLSTTNFYQCVRVSETLQKSNNNNGCDRPLKKKWKRQRRRETCQTDQLVLIIHSFQSNLTVNIFVFVLEKKKRRDGMSQVVLPFYSQTLWAEGVFFFIIYPQKIIHQLQYIQSRFSLNTTMQDPLSHFIIIVLWMFSTFSCGWKRALKCVYLCVRACVLVGKCTNQIKYKRN